MKIYNSLTKKKQEFVPIHAGKVSMYVCGNTVYDLCHIGHARSAMVFDMVTRYLRWQGYEVTYVRNITDIEDKIIKRAAENNESCDELTARMIQAMHDDEAALGVVSPDHEPRATNYIQEIITLIEQLLAKKHAYVADNGDVYFNVRSFAAYGKLSNRNVDDLLAGTRVEVAAGKKDSLDFVLWKIAKPDEPTWDSPWGGGRPGWHIECSAMSSSLLGQPFDIHGGGLDLKFPHHENEVAQSEAACGKEFANIWMHAGLLQVNGEKMSKSLGNFFTIRDVLAQHHPEVVRFFMLSSHYRSPVNYEAHNLAQARVSLERLYVALRDVTVIDSVRRSDCRDQFVAAMDDDFNTSEALAVLFAMAHAINRLKEQGKQDQAAAMSAELRALASAIGILQEDPVSFLQGDIATDEAATIEALIAARNQARENKDWSGADKVRDQLTAMGISIEDGAAGTTWRRL